MSRCRVNKDKPLTTFCASYVLYRVQSDLFDLRAELFLPEFYRTLDFSLTILK
jgi:hypothetical protein